MTAAPLRARSSGNAKRGTALLCILTASAALLPLGRPYPESVFTLLSSVCLTGSLAVLVILLQRRHLLLAFFLLFHVYSAFVLWLMNYVLKVPMSSWREDYLRPEAFIDVLGAYIAYLAVLAAASLVASWSLSHGRYFRRGREEALVFIDPRGSRRAIYFFVAFTCLFALAFSGGVQREEFLLEASVSDKFWVRASFVALLVAFTLLLLSHRGVQWLKDPFFWTVAFTSVVIAGNGFRYLSVTIALVAGACYVLRAHITMKQAMVTMLVSTAVYLLLLFFALTRQAGLGFVEVFAWIGGADLSLTDVALADMRFADSLSYVGGAQQLNLIAFEHFTRVHEHFLWGRTYFDAILRILPNGIHSALFDTIRPQDYILEHGAFVPDVFYESNWTIGADFNVEAYLNFGVLGPVVVSIAHVAAFWYLERYRHSTATLAVWYFAAVGYAYSAAWYGFGNFIKETTFALLIAALAVHVLKLRPLRTRIHRRLMLYRARATW